MKESGARIQLYFFFAGFAWSTSPGLLPTRAEAAVQSFASIKTGPDHTGLLFLPACYGVYPNSIMNILLKLNLTNLGSCGILDCNGILMRL